MSHIEWVFLKPLPQYRKIYIASVTDTEVVVLWRALFQ